MAFYVDYCSTLAFSRSNPELTDDLNIEKFFRLVTRINKLIICFLKKVIRKRRRMLNLFAQSYTSMKIKLIPRKKKRKRNKIDI